MKTRLVVPLVGLAISFALPMFGQQKETLDAQAVEKADPLAGKYNEAENSNDAAAMTVRLENEGLTFTLPPEWVAIPKQEVVRRFAEVLKSQAKSVAILAKPWKYGYQTPGAPWFSYPYLVIIQQETERVPESEFRDLPNIDLNAILEKETPTRRATNTRSSTKKKCSFRSPSTLSPREKSCNMNLNKAAYVIWMHLSTKKVN